ncbi:MAG: LamG domain-containing protein [Planctomycetota bacterium]
MFAFRNLLVLAACLLVFGSSVQAELIVHLTFDGSLEDEIGDNEGEMLDAGLLPIDPVFVEGFDGTVDGAVRFDGNSVAVYRAADSDGALPLTIKPEFSIAMWVRLGDGPLNDRRVFSESTSLDANPLFNIGTDNTGTTGKLDQFIRNGAYTTGHVKSEQWPFVLDEWHHVAWTTNEIGETKVYIDGLLDPINFDYERQIWDRELTTIGGILRATTCCLYTGDIDDVKLYDHILTPEEVQELTCFEKCPAEGDTHCGALDIVGPDDGTEGSYTVQVIDAEDDSGDSILYTYEASRDGADPIVIGPTPIDMATFPLDGGDWTITVSVDDTPCCDDVADDATCEETITVESTEPELLSHWTFDGHTEDEVGSNDGVFLNGGIEDEPLFVEGADGNPEGAIRFDGIDDVVVMQSRPERPLTLRPQFSIALWTKGDGTVDNADDRVFSESNTFGENGPLFNLGTHVSGANATLDVFIRSNAGTIANHWPGSAPAFDNSWHHIAYTDDNGQVTVYIDGVLDDALSRTYVRPTPAEQPVDTITIGAILRQTLCCMYTGDIDDVRVYNYILSEEEALEVALGGRCLVRRTIDASYYLPGDTFEVKISTTNVAGATTITETFPEGLSVADAGGGTVNGNTIEFSIDTDSEITYTLGTADYCDAITISGTYAGGEDCTGDVSGSGVGPTCAEGCGDLYANASPTAMIMLGPIAAGAPTGPMCDDNGLLGETDYLISIDGDHSEEDLEVRVGDELIPDFGGEAGGTGVALAPNLDINPRRDEGILTAWLASVPSNGLLNLDLPQNIGAPLDDYIIYGLTYLENTTGDDLPVTLRVGSDDAVKVLLNGEQIHLNAVCRGVPGELLADPVPAILEPGINTVLIAVVERGGGTGMRLHVYDEFDFEPLADGSVVACLSPGESAPREICDNGIDDDNNGDTDCQDEACADRAECAGSNFVRGDADASGAVNITDGIFVLNFLFLGGNDPSCKDAADADDSGAVNITDGIFILNFLFLGGGDPAPPFKACGIDTTEDATDCLTPHNLGLCAP